MIITECALTLKAGVTICEMNWKEGLRRIAWVGGLLGSATGLAICALNLDLIRSSFELITGGPVYEVTTQKQMSEENRSKLDKIVMEMEARRETHEAIQAKVNAYKQEHTPTMVTRIHRARIEQQPSGNWVPKTSEQVSADELAGYENIILFASLPVLGFVAPFLLLRLATWILGGFHAST